MLIVYDYLLHIKYKELKISYFEKTLHWGSSLSLLSWP